MNEPFDRAIPEKAALFPSEIHKVTWKLNLKIKLSLANGQPFECGMVASSFELLASSHKPGENFEDSLCIQSVN